MATKELTPEELVAGCERQMADCRRMARQILSPVQITALEASGLRIVPEWMINVLLKVINRDRSKDSTPARSPRDEARL